MAEVKTWPLGIGADPLHELIKGGSLMCTGGSQKRIDGPHSVKYSKQEREKAGISYGIQSLSN